MSSDAHDTGLLLPSCAQWSDDALGRGSDEDFADFLYQRALEAGKDIYDRLAYTLVEIDPQTKKAALIFYLRRRSWAEWYFGVGTPARQITLLPDEATSLKLALSRQIVDELRHHDVFAREVRRLGGESDLTRFEPPQGLLRMYREQVETMSPAGLAAANQYSGEIVLSVQADANSSVLPVLVGAGVASAIEDIETDEPAHIAIGRALVVRHAATIEGRREMADAQERFLRAQIAQHIDELQTLGSRRIRSAPSFVAQGSDQAGRGR